MIKNFYISAWDEDIDGKAYAYVIKISSEDNLKTMINRHKNLKACNLAPTKKGAEYTVNEWNNEFKESGTYMFAEGPF